MVYSYSNKTGILQIPGMKDSIIYKSDAMKYVIDEVEILSEHDFPVLVVGDTGTGKGLISQAIHCLGGHTLESFAKIDCVTIEANLVLSELFGHVKGAFTGAIDNKKGVFSQIGKKTIFLDEIGDQDQKFQSALLSVVETGEFRPVGKPNGDPMKIKDMRIIAATNVNLDEAINNRRFRKDLYYRLEKGFIFLPPLSERKEDIPPLINYLLILQNNKLNKNVILSKQAYEELLSYDFPGNVRQLETLIERAVMMAPENGFYETFSDRIGKKEFKDKIKIIPKINRPLKKNKLELLTKEIKSDIKDILSSINSIDSHLNSFETGIYKKALELTKNNKSKAAKILDVPYTKFYYKIKKDRIN